MKAKKKGNAVETVCIAALMAAISILAAWMFVSWVESPSEQPVSYSNWMQELTENG